MSQCVSPWVYPPWDSLYFLDLVDSFLSHVREVFSYYLFKCFLRSFLSLFSFQDPYDANVVYLMLSQRSLMQSSFLFFVFFIFPMFYFSAVISILSSRSLIHFSASNSLLLVPSLTVAPRLHRHHSTEDKTSRLMVKTALSC